ncbi:MAG: DUF1295 domain-containing protein [Deltaproteobacteria bacterium]|nr:DUF1295 domain-containing protein [Deltaproteobacteria bacterium]
MDVSIFETSAFDTVVCAWFAVGGVTFVALLFITAPYGRHGRRGWGPAVNPRIGWVVMELPAALGVPIFLAISNRGMGLAGLVFLTLWEIHYLQRALAFPLLLSPASSPIPISVVSMGFVFNVFNVHLQGGWLYRAGPWYGVEWLHDVRFLVGVALFLSGMALNWHSDAILRRLRTPGETGYEVPHGGLFRWVTCPNYLGEMVEWMGWAIATWSLAGAAFAFWTAANLVPRALAHHRWYREKFPEYPKGRRAIIPHVL